MRPVLTVAVGFKMLLVAVCGATIPRRPGRSHVRQWGTVMSTDMRHRPWAVGSAPIYVQLRIVGEPQMSSSATLGFPHLCAHAHSWGYDEFGTMCSSGRVIGWSAATRRWSG